MALSRRGFLVENRPFAVALYFFEVRHNGRGIADEEGDELASLQEARQSVLTTLSYIAKEELADGDQREVSITARDETGREVFTASLSLRFAWTDSVSQSPPAIHNGSHIHGGAQVPPR